MGEERNENACELKSPNYKTGADSLPSKMQNGEGDRNIPGVHVSADTETPISGGGNVTATSVSTSNITSSGLEFAEKEAEYFTDKNVTDCEVRKLIVCYKEGAYHVVKDICIDEVVDLVDKILVEDGDVNGKSDLTNEAMDSKLSISEGIKSLVAHDCVKDTADQCGSENLMQKDEGNFDQDKIPNKVLDQTIVPETLHSVRDFDREKPSPELLNLDEDKDQRQYDQDLEMAVLTKSSQLLAGEDCNGNNDASEIPFSTKLETRSITFDFNSSSPKTSKREEVQTTDYQHPLESPQISGHEDEMPDSLTSSRRSFCMQHGHGESSFSAGGPLSGLLGNSGPIPSSGSVSLRSESSTTSARSFAFPVLQSEWHSSPVRMVKADRRRIRKRWGCRLGLLCCRF